MGIELLKAEIAGQREKVEQYRASIQAYSALLLR